MASLHRSGPAILCLLLCLPLPARGQVAPPPRKSVFEQVIPEPTGENGYEELIQAAELARSSAQWRAVESAGSGVATLEMKRRMLQDPPVRRALVLLRRGLGKPVGSPRRELTFSTPLPEYSLFRSLARLLAVQEYVLLADGRTEEAIEILFLTIRFSRVIQTDTLISGLVGQAMVTLAVRPIGDHFKQLSARDCELLFRHCRDELRRPNALVTLLERERQSASRMVLDFAALMKAKGIDGLDDFYGPDPSDEKQAVRADLEQVVRSPDAVDQFAREVLERTDRRISRVLEEVRKPAWLRGSLDPDPGEDPAGRFTAYLTTPYARFTELMERETAFLRLLACQAAIERYRWEHSRLPDSLEILRLRDVAVDPYTGRPFEYTVRGERYSLRSAGAKTDPTDVEAVDGRRPIFLSPEG